MLKFTTTKKLWKYWFKTNQPVFIDMVVFFKNLLQEVFFFFLNSGCAMLNLIIISLLNISMKLISQSHLQKLWHFIFSKFLKRMNLRQIVIKYCEINLFFPNEWIHWYWKWRYYICRRLHRPKNTLTLVMRYLINWANWSMEPGRLW